ncbi:MAG: hypothetical protein KAR47_10560 [Planctomycetes bacterium]|nr:hypothetical protein [Planctomycetota bacterium]
MPATKTKSKTKATAKPKAKAKAKTTTKSSVGMTMPQVKSKATGLGITPGKMNKYDLIHAIQESECCTPCYGTCGFHCEQADCCFITDCVRVK